MPTYCAQLLWVVLDSLGVQDFSVVLAHIEVFVVMVGQGNLLVVVTQLEIGHIVIHLHRSLIRATGLLPLLGLLLELLDLLGALLRLAVEIPLVDFADEDGSLCPVATLNTQTDLFQDELGLFSSGHGPKCLHLQFAKDVRRGIEVALGFLDIRNDACHTGSLDFDENLRKMLDRGLRTTPGFAKPTFPSVTVRRVSMTDSLTSKFGV